MRSLTISCVQPAVARFKDSVEGLGCESTCFLTCAIVIYLLKWTYGVCSSGSQYFLLINWMLKQLMTHLVAVCTDRIRRAHALRYGVSVLCV